MVSKWEKCKTLLNGDFNFRVAFVGAVLCLTVIAAMGLALHGDPGGETIARTTAVTVILLATTIFVGCWLTMSYRWLKVEIDSQTLHSVLHSVLRSTTNVSAVFQDSQLSIGRAVGLWLLRNAGLFGRAAGAIAPPEELNRPNQRTIALSEVSSRPDQRANTLSEVSSRPDQRANTLSEVSSRPDQRAITLSELNRPDPESIATPRGSLSGNKGEDTISFAPNSDDNWTSTPTKQMRETRVDMPPRCVARYLIEEFNSAPALVDQSSASATHVSVESEEAPSANETAAGARTEDRRLTDELNSDSSTISSVAHPKSTNC